ncbi:MAG: bifunctional folylpolyglutamate synthase/dihydrofolate synthase [Clostridia bacterium]|nr:bifunctional folylpolyglutamate synthase/dihydrofolate synthase [Clostridia bacterium]
MNYDEALDFIHSVSKIGTKLGLENIKRLLMRLHNPQKDLKFIHVAGTNGKGTVCSTLSEILISEGYRVGLYTSPFIYDFCERMRVNGKNIERDDLARITETVKKTCEEIVADGFAHPTEFEIVTAIGMCYFKEQKCDYVVLEVGLGGRLDATNAIDAPLVSVITSISFDHTEYLGNTLSDIAYEKCGIIKKGSRAAVYPSQNPEAQAKIEEICRERGVPFENAKEPQVLSADLDGTEFLYDGVKYKTHLKGGHMIKNIATALCTVKLLREAGVKVSGKAVKDGIENVVWSGRFEVIGKEPLFIIDGAHNLEGILALKNAIQTYLPGMRLIFVMGMLRDKEYENALAEIAPMADKFISCTVPSPRTLKAEELSECAKKYNKNIYTSKSIDEAVKKAFSEADEKSAIVAFGSLYMLGDIRAAFDKIKEN